MATAIIPLKDLVQAKSRLAGVLRPAERRMLAQAMAEDVLRVLQGHPGITRTILVTDDPSGAQLAQLHGAQCLSEAGLGGGGLNAVLQAGSALVQQRYGGPQLILHADLPLLSSADLDQVLTALRSGGLVIGGDRHGTGTNLLAFAAGSAPQFQFGAGSYAAHVTSAANNALAVTPLTSAGIGMDVDEPADLAALLHCDAVDSAPATAAFLRDSDISSRLQLTLAGRPVSETNTSHEEKPFMNSLTTLEHSLLKGALPDDETALALADFDNTAELAALACSVRDRAHGNTVTYSRKVFIPLTHLCRDVCHYCTFAQTPKKIEQPYMSIDEVLRLCHEGAAMGCQEALFTLGERPELRYSTARKALAELGYDSTLHYVAAVAERVLEETGLLPHINAGCMDEAELALLRPVSASMGIMLESASTRLCEKGMPHYGSPDKDPARRLQTLELAGRAAVPFTSGILIGIGETRRERIESLLALRAAHRRHGHLQEVIVQNFRAKPGTLMASAPEPDLNELLWTIAVARLIFGGEMNIQAPPNLSPGVLPQLVNAGINDWGGVSPLTPDHVNPEAPWPHLERLARETAAAGKFLEQRLTIYPEYVRDSERWLDTRLTTAVLRHSDAAGYARRDSWVPGEEQPVPALEAELLREAPDVADVSDDIRDIVARCQATDTLDEADVVRLFNSRGADFSYVVHAADTLRRQTNGDHVSYVVNRNINYTNVCYFKCQFCAFSKGKHSENLRGKPYDISGDEIARRSREAWQRGATEVCMQGGIHPDYTGQTYLDIVTTVRAATPGMHIHAFSPLEVQQGAATLGESVPQFLQMLKEAGLSTLPGTAAEVLHDDVRKVLCPDKLNTAEWFDVIAAAHEQGIRTTATIMYGHVDRPVHWAAHLLGIRELQQRTGGFTEFVPLPFVHMEAPMYLKGRARCGPTFREAVLMHAVARLVFHGLIDNIQTSWVKMGREGVSVCLAAGANDLGGSLMNESITRAAGSGHGQEWSPADMEVRIRALGRIPRMRTTLYRDVSGERRAAAQNTIPLLNVENAPAGKRQRSKLPEPLLFDALGADDALAGGAPLYENVVLTAACN